MQKSSHLAYKITDPLHYSQNPTRFLLKLRKSQSADVTTLRDKSHPKLQKVAKRFKASVKYACINQDFALAKRLGVRCVHFTGAQLELAKRARRAGFFTVFSAHSFEDLARAKRYRIDLLTYSPIFPTPGKGEPLGLRTLRRATRKLKNIIALGGIVTKKEMKAVRLVKARGFASIRAFV